MKRQVMPCIAIAAIALVLTLHDTSGQSSSLIELQAPTTIRAGDAWEAHLEVPGGQAGESIEASLFNGLRRYPSTLVLGSGGAAIWSISEGVILQSGESLILLRYHDEELRESLRVLPARAQTVDLLTTANEVPAYSAARAMLIALPRDQWGNPPLTSTHLSAEAQFPEGHRETVEFSYRGGLAWAWLRSQGAPGRVRIRMQVQEAVASLEIMQMPGRAANLSLSVSPDCTFADGRDQIALVADVTDADGNAVSNGTLVNFVWEDGEGKGLTIDGRASIRIPAPASLGEYRFYAESAGARSTEMTLRIVEQSCTP